jgi:diguanylate cyclase
MLLTRRKKAGSENVVDINNRLKDSENRENAYNKVIRILLVLIKEFALDIAEIKTDRFYASMDGFSEKFLAQKTPKRILSGFDKQKTIISAFIDDQKGYLSEREDELRKIIDLLTRAMVSVDSENDAYHRKIMQQSEKMEKITRLDDIRKIKSALEKEVETLRETVRNKQAGEQARIQNLSSQVKTLSHELEQAKKESLRDGLTGIYNRRAFDDYLQSLTERNLLHRQDFSVLILDIDDFKAVNDTYGHPVGDRVLLAMANTFGQMVRSDDFLARYGGEEFVMVLPGASRRNAAKKAKQICKTIHKTRFTLDQDDSQPPLALTVSIGVTAFKKGDMAATVLERADQALYQAKQAGKNCVITK